MANVAALKGEYGAKNTINKTKKNLYISGHHY